MLASGGADVALAHRACSATMSCRYTSSSSAVSKLGQVQTHCMWSDRSQHVMCQAHAQNTLSCPTLLWDLQRVHHWGAFLTCEACGNCTAVGAASQGAVERCQSHRGHPALQSVHVPAQPHDVVQYNSAVQSHGWRDAGQFRSHHGRLHVYCSCPFCQR